MKAKAKTVTALERGSVLYGERAAKQKSPEFSWAEHFREWRGEREKAESPVFEKEKEGGK